MTPGETGWLVPAGDVPSLARTMRDALEAPGDALAAMGAKARDAVLKNHDIATEAAKLRDAIVSAHRSSA